MDFLLADSGSTKTDWRLVVNGRVDKHFRTEGFNPYHIGREKFKTELEANVVSQTGLRKDLRVFFYGSGCGSVENQLLWKEVIGEYYPSEKVEVFSDLLGAARALCGNEKGIAAILGTGSNSCVYDGEKITDTRPSLGYILGDEGSGVAIGKTFIRKYLYGEIGDELRIRFNEFSRLSEAEIIRRIYREPFANRFLASFAAFVSANVSFEECRTILYDCFREFFDQHIHHYDHHALPLYFTGSVAIHNKGILNEVAEKNNVAIKAIVAEPIEGLVKFHSQINSI